MSSSEFEAREASIRRETGETKITASLGLDGDGTTDIDTGVGFLDHMLDLFASHSGFDLDVQASGDLQVDDHHTVEDVGITLGQAFRAALDEKRYIERFGSSYVPMDDALARTVVDLSGRFYFRFEGKLSRPTVGEMSTEMVRHFWYSFAENARINLHIDVLAGINTHHKIEAVFKSAGRALREAVHRSRGNREMPSSKGALE